MIIGLISPIPIIGLLCLLSSTFRSACQRRRRPRKALLEHGSEKSVEVFPVAQVTAGNATESLGQPAKCKKYGQRLERALSSNAKQVSNPKLDDTSNVGQMLDGIHEVSGV